MTRETLMVRVRSKVMKKCAILTLLTDSEHSKSTNPKPRELPAPSTLMEAS